MYIPNTTYEVDIGKTGCDILEDNYKRIMSQGKKERTFACKWASTSGRRKGWLYKKKQLKINKTTLCTKN